MYQLGYFIRNDILFLPWSWIQNRNVQISADILVFSSIYNVIHEHVYH